MLIEPGRLAAIMVASRKSRLSDARPNYSSGDRKLSDVPHRVLCAVHEAADHSRREPSSSHTPKAAQCCRVDRAKLRNGCVNSCGQGAQSWRDVRCEKFLAFRPNRCELFRRQNIAAGIGEEAIDDPGNVMDMKGRGGDACRARVPFLLRQQLNNLAHALANLQKNICDWLKDGRNPVDRTALPPLSVGHLASS